MGTYKVVWVAVLALSCTQVAAGQPAEPKTYRLFVERVSSTIEPDTKIGALKQGFLCGPLGSVRFAQIRLPEHEDLGARIADKLTISAKHLSVQHVLPDKPDKQLYVLTASLDEMRLNLCVPGPNIGFGNRKTRGKGTIKITWQLWHKTDGALSLQQQSWITISDLTGDPRKNPAPLAELLATSAASFLDDAVATLDAKQQN
jgi:hypothetical protein